MFARNLTPFRYTLTPPPSGLFAVYDKLSPSASDPENVVCPPVATYVKCLNCSEPYCSIVIMLLLDVPSCNVIVLESVSAKSTTGRNLTPSLYTEIEPEYNLKVLDYLKNL